MPNWHDVIRRIQALLDKYRPVLLKEHVEEIMHYLEHDEYEMAFEILCLDLLKCESFEREDLVRCIAFARELHLDDPEVVVYTDNMVLYLESALEKFQVLE